MHRECIGHLPCVLHVEHLRVDFVVERPLGREGVAHEIHHVAGRRARVGVEATRLVEAVVLHPESALHGVGAEADSQVAEAADAHHVILCRADGDGRGDARSSQTEGERVGVGRKPGALAFLLVMVHARRERDVFADICLVGQAGEVVVTQARSVIVRIIGRRDRRGIDRAGRRVGRGEARVAAVVGHVGDEVGERPVRCGIVPAGAETLDHLQRKILIVRFATFGVVVISLDLAERQRHGEAGVPLVNDLLATVLPLVLLVMNVRDIAARAAEGVDRAGFQTAIAAEQGVAAAGESEHAAAFLAGATGCELQRAAEVRRRVRAKNARALAELHVLDVLRDRRARDVQAVEVAVGHVAQRNAVDGEAELLLLERRTRRRPCSSRPAGVRQA
ncbi:MAG: hypothetical protein FD124_3366 [Alphaproteobacteria bacterium]|nr:MAG: hypothetical protein FD124_3366 [Alphaproteobacteria bacterium]